MTTFAEIKQELEYTKQELQKFRDKYTETRELNEMLAARAESHLSQIKLQQDLIQGYVLENSSLRDEFMKSIFVARTPVAADAEEAMQYTIEAVAYCARQKKPREPDEGEKACADITKANRRANGEDKPKRSLRASSPRT